MRFIVSRRPEVLNIARPNYTLILPRLCPIFFLGLASRPKKETPKVTAIKPAGYS